MPRSPITPLSDPAGGPQKLTRKELLQRAAGGGLALAAAGSGLDLAALAQAASTPVRGGQLRVGFVGGGTAETLNPNKGILIIDSARIQNIFDPLVLVNPDLSTSPGLALEWNPNKTFTEYEVKLRPGVVFHNGKSFTADDVIYSIRLMSNSTSAALPFVAGIDLHGLKKQGPLTLRIPLKYPDASLQDNFVYYNTWIVQDGETNFSRPVGTGPFSFVSFSPGQQSIFKRNPNYWMHGKPYVDTLKFVSISDDTARLNALLAGEIDAMAQLPFLEARAHKSAGDLTVLSAPGPQPMMFYMDTTKPPFSDNRVRLAMKLIADRPALIEGALAGFGTVGNDIVGKGLPFFDSGLPQRVQDIPRAKSLLKAAGVPNLHVLLQTSNLFPGFVESATLLAQQAAAAGVTITLKQVPADAYYNPALLYLKMAFAETQWPAPSLKYFYLQALAATAPYNETHWKSPSFNSLLFKAIGEGDRAKAQAYWNQLQQVQYNDGGYINWAQYNWVDGLSKKVHGLAPSAYGVLGNFEFLNAWLT